MALLWIEGFEGFGTSTGSAPSPTDILSRKYPLVNGESGMDIETGRGGSGYCLEIGVSTGNYFQSPNLTTDPTCVVGAAVRVPTMPSGLNLLLALYDGTTLGMNIRMDTDGTLKAYRGVTLVGSTVSALTTNTWYYLEFKIYTHNSAGTIDINVNGTSWLSLTSQDTAQAALTYHTAFRLQAPSLNTSWDDVYFLDATGSANNDLLGNRKVVAIAPGSAGDSTDWTPSAGSNYQNVDDGALLDEDTTYNETSTDNHQDLYNYANLPSDIATVDGVQITSEGRVTTGSMDLSAVIKTGTTTSVGSPESITSTTYVTTVRVAEQDPDTAAAWTPGGVDGAQFGVKANT
jgi:hypothetical protein